MQTLNLINEIYLTQLFWSWGVTVKFVNLVGVYCFFQLK